MLGRPRPDEARRTRDAAEVPAFESSPFRRSRVLRGEQAAQRLLFKLGTVRAPTAREMATQLGNVLKTAIGTPVLSMEYEEVLTRVSVNLKTPVMLRGTRRGSRLWTWRGPLPLGARERSESAALLRKSLRTRSILRGHRGRFGLGDWLSRPLTHLRATAFTVALGIAAAHCPKERS